MQHEIRLCEQGASLSQMHHEFPKKKETCANCVKYQTKQEFFKVREPPLVRSDRTDTKMIGNVFSFDKQS